MDFEDDGASFRVRREQQLAEMYPPSPKMLRMMREPRRVTAMARPEPIPPFKVPLVVRLSLWMVGAAALVFGAIVAAVLVLAVFDNLPGL